MTSIRLATIQVAVKLPLILVCATIGAFLGTPIQGTDPATLKREINVPTPGGAIACLDPDTAQTRLRIGVEPCSAFERSPDGLWLARLLYSGVVVIHDAADGSERAQFQAIPFVAPTHGPLDWADEWWEEDRCLRFAGSNDRLVLAKGHRVSELWSLEPAERIAQLSIAGEHATSIDVSFDGSRIVTGDTAGQVALWSALDDELVHEPWQVEHRVTALHFDPAGQRIAIASLGCNVHLLELGDGALRRLDLGPRTGTGHSVGLDDVRFDFSGRQLIAVTGDCTPNVVAWEISTGERTWKRELPWAGPPARQSADGERWLLGNRGVWLDGRTGATLGEAFPLRENQGLQTNGNVAWKVEGDQLRLFTLGDPVRIRDVRLAP